MSTIAHTRNQPAVSNGLYTVALWPALAAGDDGDPIRLAQYADRTVQIGGTLDGATVAIKGSIDGDEYHTLTDPQGNALSFTAAGIEAITELVAYLKPVVTGGGAGTSINVNLLLKG